MGVAENGHGAARAEFVGALEGLLEALEGNVTIARDAARRAKELVKSAAEGDTISAVMRAEAEPRLLDLIGRNRERLNDAGARLRRAEALVLHSEGMSMDRIAELFGVSRQRISYLLREPADR